MKDKINERKQRTPAKRDDVCFPIADTLHNLPTAYPSFLSIIVNTIDKQRTVAIHKVNIEQLVLYWQLGQQILSKQQEEGWGAKVIDRLSHDLKKHFPALSGFSPRNLKYMAKFAENWPDLEFVQRTVAQLPWRSNCALLDKVKEADARLWYAKQALEQGWSRDILVLHIENNDFERVG